MRSYPTRAEKRETELYVAAERGHLTLEKAFLYPGEIKKLEKEGFHVTNIKPSGMKQKLFNATIDWSSAYGGSIPHIVYSYINHMIDTEPQNSIHTFAQKLYVIAHRTINKT